MKIRSADFRVKQVDKVKLDKWPTAVEPVYESKKQYQKLLRDHVTQLSSLQHLLYASNRYAVLLIFQAMDAAGKDGAIKHLGSIRRAVRYSTRDLPERGRIGIFNRSYYEEVLIVRVHPRILEAEGIGDGWQWARRRLRLCGQGRPMVWLKTP